MNILSLFSIRFTKSSLITLLVWVFALSNISSTAFGHPYFSSHTHVNDVAQAQAEEDKAKAEAKKRAKERAAEQAALKKKAAAEAKAKAENGESPTLWEKVLSSPGWAWNNVTTWVQSLQEKMKSKDSDTNNELVDYSPANINPGKTNDLPLNTPKTEPKTNEPTAAEPSQAKKPSAETSVENSVKNGVKNSAKKEPLATQEETLNTQPDNQNKKNQKTSKQTSKQKNKNTAPTLKLIAVSDDAASGNVEGFVGLGVAFSFSVDIKSDEVAVTVANILPESSAVGQLKVGDKIVGIQRVTDESEWLMWDDMTVDFSELLSEEEFSKLQNRLEVIFENAVKEVLSEVTSSLGLDVSREDITAFFNGNFTLNQLVDYVKSLIDDYNTSAEGFKSLTIIEKNIQKWIEKSLAVVTHTVLRGDKGTSLSLRVQRGDAFLTYTLDRKFIAVPNQTSKTPNNSDLGIFFDTNYDKDGYLASVTVSYLTKRGSAKRGGNVKVGDTIVAVLKDATGKKDSTTYIRSLNLQKSNHEENMATVQRLFSDYNKTNQLHFYVHVPSEITLEDNSESTKSAEPADELESENAVEETPSAIEEAVNKANELKMSYLKAEAEALKTIVDELKNNLNAKDENSFDMAKARLAEVVIQAEELKMNYTKAEEEALKDVLDKLQKSIKATEEAIEKAVQEEEEKAISQVVEAVNKANELKLNYLEAEAKALKNIIDELKNTLNAKDKNSFDMAKAQLEEALSHAEELKMNYTEAEAEALKDVLDTLQESIEAAKAVEESLKKTPQEEPVEESPELIGTPVEMTESAATKETAPFPSPSVAQLCEDLTGMENPADIDFDNPLMDLCFSLKIEKSSGISYSSVENQECLNLDLSTMPSQVSIQPLSHQSMSSPFMSVSSTERDEPYSDTYNGEAMHWTKALRMAQLPAPAESHVRLYMRFIFAVSGVDISHFSIEHSKDAETFKLCANYNIS